MNERINLQDLTAFLAEKAGITKKDAETFLREYFEVMNEELIKDGSLKIKDLGAFKILQVEDRESIDVTTGERVLIPAHYKVAFTPDKRLAETVNEPFAYFETTEINEESGLDDLKLLSEENAIDEFEPTLDEEEPVIPIEPSVEKESLPKPLLEKEPSVAEEPETSSAKSDDCRHCHYVKRYHTYRGEYYKTRRKLKRSRIIIGILSGLLAIASGYIAYQLYIGGFSSLGNTAMVIVPVKSAPSRDTVLNVTEESADSIIPVKQQPVKRDVSETRISDDTKQMIIAPGQRLATIAQNEYGNKLFWIYIWLENKEVIRNPDVLPVGAKITIPPADKYGIDNNDSASVQRAKDEAMKYP